MKYLCLVYEDQSHGRKLPKSEIEKAMAAYDAFTSELKKSGRAIQYGALPPDTATTVRVRNGQRSVTDGPFIETKEQLGVYYLIEARDLNEAIRVAENIPSAMGQRRGPAGDGVLRRFLPQPCRFSGSPND